MIPHLIATWPADHQHPPPTEEDVNFILQFIQNLHHIWSKLSKSSIEVLSKSAPDLASSPSNHSNIKHMVDRSIAIIAECKDDINHLYGEWMTVTGQQSSSIIHHPSSMNTWTSSLILVLLAIINQNASLRLRLTNYFYEINKKIIKKLEILDSSSIVVRRESEVQKPILRRGNSGKSRTAGPGSGPGSGSGSGSGPGSGSSATPSPQPSVLDSFSNTLSKFLK